MVAVTVLVALHDGKRVEAFYAKKDITYKCPGCGNVVVIKQGRIRVCHFAHKQESSCSLSINESKEHRIAKLLVRDSLRRRGLKAEIEWIIDCLPGDRRADVVTWSCAGNMYAIEVQQSSISMDELESRTESYFRAGVRVLWLVLINSKRIEESEIVYYGKKWIERYAARQWERWIHGFNYGHIWFFDIDSLQLWNGNFTSHELYVESSSWHEDGEERSAGGYFKYSKKYKELELRGPFTLDEIQITPFLRQQRNLGNCYFPKGTAATFVPKKLMK